MGVDVGSVGGGRSLGQWAFVSTGVMTAARVPVVLVGGWGRSRRMGLFNRSLLRCCAGGGEKKGAPGIFLMGIIQFVTLPTEPATGGKHH